MNFDSSFWILEINVYQAVYTILFTALELHIL